MKTYHVYVKVFVENEPTQEECKTFQAEDDSKALEMINRLNKESGLVVLECNPLDENGEEDFSIYVG